jgi:hypothetical protein
MRSVLIFGLVFALAGAPAVQAQQVAAPASAAQTTPRVSEVPMPRMHVDTARAQAAALQPRHGQVEADAVRELTARTLLAVIGGVLVVIALVALAR